jgi:hypothetical protein
MKNFKEIWAEKAQSKNITRDDMIEYCIIKTIKAKSEDKEEVFKYYLTKAFTPGRVCAHRWHPYQTIYAGLSVLGGRYKWSKERLLAHGILETPEEWELYGKLLFAADKIISAGTV